MSNLLPGALLCDPPQLSTSHRAPFRLILHTERERHVNR